MEGGAALADVLLGQREPTGRLPFALPHHQDDLVPFDPDAREATYGLLHGQWHLDSQQVEAHLPFGFGLGYTTFAVSSAGPPSGGSATVEVTNTGGRAGTTVVFAYGSLPGSVHDRPPRRLLGFRRVTAAAGEAVTAEIQLDLAALDVRTNGAWTTEAGTYVVEVGFSATDLPVRLELPRPGG
jgi:beta-glucosidase